MEQFRNELALAEAKQEAGDKLEKKASRKSHQALQEKAQCMDEEIPPCNGEKMQEEGNPAAWFPPLTTSGTVS